MAYNVLILDTQEDKYFLVPQSLDWLEGGSYWWTEGNMGCDCNLCPLCYPESVEADCNMGTGSMPRFRALFAFLPDDTVKKLSDFQLVFL